MYEVSKMISLDQIRNYLKCVMHECVKKIKKSNKLSRKLFRKLVENLELYAVAASIWLSLINPFEANVFFFYSLFISLSALASCKFCPVNSACGPRKFIPSVRLNMRACITETGVACNPLTSFFLKLTQWYFRIKRKTDMNRIPRKTFSFSRSGQNGSKMDQQLCFFSRLFSFSWKISKMKYTVIYISPQIPCLVKFWFLSYGPKCSQPIRLQNSFKYIISRKNWGIKPM